MRASPALRCAALVLAVGSALPVGAASIRVAVAANFMEPMREIAAGFEKEQGHALTLVSGATGRFYAQIVNGAPFDVLLAADDETPARLEREGLGVAGTRFTYAVGRLALWSPVPGYVDAKAEVLARKTYTHLAIANPEVAPYGAAAREALKKLGHWDALRPRLVLGENIAQTYQFVDTGGAGLGFVALSQIQKDGRLSKGSAWVVPMTLHAPLRQDAIVLDACAERSVCTALAAYLKSGKAKAVLRRYGYEIP